MKNITCWRLDSIIAERKQRLIHTVFIMSNDEQNQLGEYGKKSSIEGNDCEDKRDSATTVTHTPPYTCEFCKCAPCLFFEHFQGCGELISCLLKCDGMSRKEANKKLSCYYYKKIEGEDAVDRLNYSKALPFCINAEIVALIRQGDFEIYEHNPFRIWPAKTARMPGRQ